MNNHRLIINFATDSDWSNIEQLLKDCGLPAKNIRNIKAKFLIIKKNTELIAVGALEKKRQHALLRSIAVAAPHRNQNFGIQLVNNLMKYAELKKVKTLYLLTETAADFFQKLGFQHIDRSLVPAPIQQTSEFSDCCCQQASCMYKII